MLLEEQESNPCLPLIYSINQARWWSCFYVISPPLATLSRSISIISKSLTKFSLELQKALCTFHKAAFLWLIIPGIWLFISSQQLVRRHSGPRMMCKIQYKCCQHFPKLPFENHRWTHVGMRFFFSSFFLK